MLYGNCIGLTLQINAFVSNTCLRERIKFYLNINRLEVNYMDWFATHYINYLSFWKTTYFAVCYKINPLSKTLEHRTSIIFIYLIFRFYK